MARREPERRKRRPGGARGTGRPRPADAKDRSTLPGTPAQPAAPALPSSREARIAFALGAVAFLALPITYQWTFKPASRPFESDGVVQVLELLGVLAAAAALLLGRRARAAGDRSSGAVWGPRLGGAAIVGYAMAFFVLMSRGGQA